MALLMERTPESRLPIDAEFRALLPSGSYRWLLASSQAVHDPQGHILRRMGTMIDVTQRKRAEEKLRDSEQNFRRLVESIAEVAKERPPEEKLDHLKTEITELLSYISAQQSQTFNSDSEAFLARANSLRQVEIKCRKLADSTKSWKDLKEKGRAALAGEIQIDFDRLWKICAANGLFINPCGELESMLTDYGIAYTNQKHDWIVQALQLIPNFEVTDQKQPWQFIKAIHEHISPA